MCGIVGYIGKGDAREIVLTGLEKLEYRGYDSAGISLINKDTKDYLIYKDKGRIKHLRDLCDFSFPTNVGIGHTRWATHGEPNFVNSHPHSSESGRFIIVHNGVIENFRKLKVDYLENYHFKSQTDTEVIVNLIEYYSKKICVDSAIRKVMSLLEGSYALIIMDKENPDLLYVVKNKTPLLIGCNDTGVVVASDTIALAGHADKYFFLEDQRFAIISEKGIQQFDMLGMTKENNFSLVKKDDEEISKGQYEHFMLKEIEEQPGVIRRLLSNYFDGEKILLDDKTLRLFRTADKINLVACGTSMYASLVGKYYFEKLCGIPTEVFVASELVYSTPMLTKNPLFVFVSQSGETADCISVMKKCRERDFKMALITNSVNSTMSYLADATIDIYAGKEIAVASTKAYVAQVATMAILAKAVSEKRTNLKNNLNRVALVIDNMLVNKSVIKGIAKEIMEAKSVFFIGRGLDYWTCLEGSLKLKEISYIHSEAFSSGELKHGSIALIEKGVPVIALVTQEGTNNIVRNNLIETISRGASGYIVSSEALSLNDDDVIIPDVAHYLTPIISTIVFQLLAYYCALYKGNDVDKPKNLAKSVTVE